MTVTVEPCGARFRIYVTSHGRKAEAGERIFRAKPWPDIQFCHDLKEDAETDAEQLRLYLAHINRTAKISKRALRAFGS